MIRRAARVAEIETERATYVLDLDGLAARSNPVEFSGAAAVIWSLIDGTRSERDIAAVIAADLTDAVSAPGPEEILEQTRAFVQELVDLGLAVRS